MAENCDTQTDRDSPIGSDSDDSSESNNPFDSDNSFTGVLSDLFVNAVPIGIILIFVLAFSVLSPFGDTGSDPLVLFHGVLICGVVLVSAVAGWVIRREDDPLRGSAARDTPIEPDEDDDTQSATADNPN